MEKAEYAQANFRSETEDYFLVLSGIDEEDFWTGVHKACISFFLI